MSLNNQPLPETNSSILESKKDKSIRIIMISVLMFYGLDHVSTLALPYYVGTWKNFLVFVLVCVGYFNLIRGSCLYSQSKGYSWKWGWLSLFYIFGLSILLLIPSKSRTYSEENTLSEQPNDVDAKFKQINIAEITLYWLIALAGLSYIIIWILSLTSNNFQFSEMIKDSNFLAIYGTIVFSIWGFLIFKEISKADLKLSKILGLKNKIEWKLILILGLTIFLFAISFDSISLYYLSFIVPNYVQDFINRESFTNFAGFIGYALSILILAPVFEELFFRGLALQKWGLKWNISKGIILSSLLFAIYHFRFDIVFLFMFGFICSLLYLRTGNLLNTILLHALYNTFVIISESFYYFKGLNDNDLVVNEIQQQIEPYLGQYLIVSLISLVILIRFIHKNFVGKTIQIPYKRNCSFD